MIMPKISKTWHLWVIDSRGHRIAHKWCYSVEGYEKIEYKFKREYPRDEIHFECVTSYRGILQERKV